MAMMRERSQDGYHRPQPYNGVFSKIGLEGRAACWQSGCRRARPVVESVGSRSSKRMQIALAVAWTDRQTRKYSSQDMHRLASD